MPPLPALACPYELARDMAQSVARRNVAENPASGRSRAGVAGRSARRTNACLAVSKTCSSSVWSSAATRRAWVVDLGPQRRARRFAIWASESARGDASSIATMPARMASGRRSQAATPDRTASGSRSQASTTA